MLISQDTLSPLYIKATPVCAMFAVSDRLEALKLELSPRRLK
jgi:hypothetical protein